MSPGLNDPNWMMVACAVPQSTLADRPIKPELDKGAHSEDAVERGGLVAWQPPHVRDEDLGPLTAGASPRHSMTSHRSSSQTPQAGIQSSGRGWLLSVHFSVEDRADMMAATPDPPLRWLSALLGSIPRSADGHAATDHHRRAGRHDRGSHADIRGSGDPAVDRQASAFPVRRHDRAGARGACPAGGRRRGLLGRDQRAGPGLGLADRHPRIRLPVEPGDKVAFREDGRNSVDFAQRVGVTPGEGAGLLGAAGLPH
jgi:hypothetical protein